MMSRPYAVAISSHRSPNFPAPTTDTSSSGRPPGKDQIRVDGSTALRGRTPQRRHEDRVLAGGVRREELDHEPVIEREPGGTEALGVRGEISATARQPRLEIGQAIAAGAERPQQRVEPSQEIDDGGRVAAQ